MPFVDLSFRLEPMRQIVSVLAIVLLPKLMRPFGDLFLQTQVLVHVKNRLVFLLVFVLFHKFSWVVIVAHFSRGVFNAPPHAMT